MYRALLLNYLEDLKVDDQEAASLASLRAILGLSDDQVASVYQAAVGPLYRAAVEEAVSAPLGSEAKSALQEKIAGLALPDNAPPNARYRPICPFCAKPLKTDARAGDQPYSRILFQSDASRDDVEGSDGDSENGGWSTASPGLTVQDATPPDTAERKNDPGDADEDAA